MLENKDEIIDRLYTQNCELDLKIRMLETMCDKLNDYISDNNLRHKRFITENENYLVYDDYKKIQTIVIPETRYLILVEDDENILQGSDNND